MDKQDSGEKGGEPEYLTARNGPEPFSPGVYTSEQLARRCGMSLKFVIKNRHRIKGAFRAGRVWRFDIAAVERAIKIRGELF